MENKTTFTVKVSDNYCEWQYGIQVDKKRCIDDLVQCIESGLKARRVYQKLIKYFNKLNNINMDNFKLDLTKLTPVAEKDRVHGNYYVAADDFSEHGTIRQWLSGNHSIHWRGGNGTEWALWFLIPPGLPGFPVSCELLDEFELKDREWEFKPDGYETFSSNIMGGIYRRIKSLPQLTIPSGTRAEQLAKLKEILADFETF